MNKEELYNKIDKFCNETDWGKYPTYEHALEEFINGNIAEETKELQKENAELKEELKKWKDEWQEQVQKATDEGYARTLQTVQLTKAKKIIRECIKHTCDTFCEVSTCEHCLFKLKVKDKAEQFLNSEEK